MKYTQFIPEHIIFALRFFLFPFVTLVLAKALFELLAFNFLDFNQVLIQRSSELNEFSSAVKLNEMKARLLWLSSVLAYFFINTVFALFIWKALRNLAIKEKLLFIVIAVVITVFEIGYLLNAEPAESPIASIFSFTFDVLSGSGLYTLNQLTVINKTLDVINLLGFMVVPFGLMAGCCIMHDIPTANQRSAEYFLNRSRQLKKLMAGGSAIMVIGVIHMQLWLNWPLALLEEPKAIAQLESLTFLVCQYWGLCYSLIIAALYLPAASYLSDEARLALLQGDNEEAKQDPGVWLKKNNMIFSPLASLPQIIAVIAPMLVGPLGSTLSGLAFF